MAKLFTQCLVIGVTSFGGGLNAYVRRVFVSRRRWITEQDFLEALEVAQTLPGPNVINLVLVLSRRLHGIPGAVVAFIGLVLPAILANICLVAFVLGRESGSALNGVLAGFGAAAAGLSIANAGQMGWAHLRHAGDIALTVVAAGTIIWLKPPLLIVIVLFGTIGVVGHLVVARRKAHADE